MERITITIEKELLDEVDKLVDGRDVKNRSHAISLLLRKVVGKSALTKAFILAGGSVKSVERALTKHGEKTVLEHLVSYLARQGIREIVLGIGQGGEKIVSLLKTGEDYGVEIEYCWDSEEGSAVAIAQAEPLLREPFLLCYSDVLFPDLDLRELHDFHAAGKGAATLVLVNTEDPKALGVAKMRGVKITSFEEKPKTHGSHLANAGVAVCDPAVFHFVKQKHGKSLEKDVLPLLSEKEKLVGYPYFGRWIHIK